MNFDDRLKNELQNQGAQINIEPAGVDDIAHRSAKRRQRRMTGMAAAVAVVLLGVGGFIATNRDGGSVPVAADATAEDLLAEDEAADDSDSEPNDITDGDVVPGTPLNFVNVESSGSPGGFGVYGSAVLSGDSYYLLSTAPGVPETEDADAYLPNTLYRFDGTEWTNSSFGDRFISSLSQDNGVLYTVSTGTKTANTPAVGSSTDGGQTWTWTELDVSSQFGDAATWPYFEIEAETANGTTFALVRANAGADWIEGIALAQQAGLDIDEENDEIVEVSLDGISWVSDAYAQSPCSALLESLMELSPEAAELQAEVDALFQQSDVSPEDVARIDELERELNVIYEEAYAAALAEVRDTAECVAFADCINSDVARGERYREAEEEGIELTDADFEALDTEFNAWLESSGCGPILGLDESDAFEENIQTATWAELGVTVPASWYGSTGAYLVEGSGSQSLGVFAEDELGWLSSVAYDGVTFEVVFEGVWSAVNEETNTPPNVTVYSSTDGVAWTKSDRPYRNATPRALVNGMSFQVDWVGESEGTVLIRKGPNGSERLSLQELAPNVDVAGYQFSQAITGDYGVVVTATKWEPEGDDSGAESSIVLFSPDGMSFGATLLDGVGLHSVTVGPTGVLIFGYNETLANSGTPQPVFFGTAS